MPADMRVKQIDGLETLAAHLGVEIHTAGCETAVFQDGQHGVRCQVNICGELVGIPAQQFIARVWRRWSPARRRPGHFELMLHAVARQRGVVRFDV